MRFKRSSIVGLAAVTLACAAQRSGSLDDDPPPMSTGRPVIVWIVKGSATPPNRSGYGERNTGSFGRTASETGQTSSTYGQTAGTFGKVSSDAGQTSSTYGQTAGTFGKVSSNAGQTAGTYGHAPSEIGSVPPSQTSSSYYGRTVNSADVSAAAHPGYADQRFSWEQPLREIAFPQGGPRVTFVDIDSAELKTRLENTNVMTTPNLLVGNPLPPEWSFGGLEARYGITMLGSLGVLEPAEQSYLEPDAGVQVAILRRAPFQDAARAFVVKLRDRRTLDSEAERRFLAWAQDSRGPVRQPQPRNDSLLTQATSVAKSTANSVLMGASVGGVADEELAKFSGNDAVHYAFLPPPGVNLGSIKIQTSVVQAYGNERLAVVAMRTVLYSPSVFGIAHPLAVLRRAPSGEWRVLQFSPNLAPQLLLHTVNVLRPYLTAVKPEYVAAVGGITQAAPVDGDNRTRFPELWWDNAGGDDLLIVEWQRRNAYADWDPSHMDLIPDTDHRLKISVPASFASEIATYRWRVWSVGLGGVTKVGGWRTLNIIG